MGFWNQPNRPKRINIYQHLRETLCQNLRTALACVSQFTPGPQIARLSQTSQWSSCLVCLQDQDQDITSNSKRLLENYCRIKCLESKMIWNELEKCTKWCNDGAMMVRIEKWAAPAVWTLLFLSVFETPVWLGAQSCSLSAVVHCVSILRSVLRLSGAKVQKPPVWRCWRRLLKSRNLMQRALGVTSRYLRYLLQFAELQTMTTGTSWVAYHCCQSVWQWGTQSHALRLSIFRNWFLKGLSPDWLRDEDWIHGDV